MDTTATAQEEQPLLLGTQALDIYRPASTSRRIDYATCPKLRFDRSHLDEPRKGPGAYAYNPHLKMLCNDVDFLTQKAKAGW